MGHGAKAGEGARAQGAGLELTVQFGLVSEGSCSQREELGRFLIQAALTHGGSHSSEGLHTPSVQLICIECLLCA